MKNYLLVQAVVTTLLSLSTATTWAATGNVTPTQTDTTSSETRKNFCAGQVSKDKEKCYGIAAASRNDCATAHGNGCAGMIKQAKDPQAWIFVPKGTCDKIADGHTDD